MTGPRVPAPYLTPLQPPHIPTGEEWAAAQYTRVPPPTTARGTGPLRRIPTGAEWEQAQRAGSGTDLEVPVLPALATIRPDATARLNPATPARPGKALAPFDLADPTTYGNPILRQVVNPVLEHPLASAAVLAAPFVAGAAAGGLAAAGGVGAAGQVAATVATTKVAGVGLALPMVFHIASYGWQKAAEQTLDPEAKAVAEADPERIAGESAAMQAILLGLAPLVHTYAKRFSPAAKAAAEARRVAQFAADLEAGATTTPPLFVRPVAGLEQPQTATMAAGRRVAPVAGLEPSLAVQPGAVPKIATEGPLPTTPEPRGPGTVPAPRVAGEFASGASAEGTGAAFQVKDLTPEPSRAKVTRRPRTASESRAADAARVEAAVRAEEEVPFFASDKGAEVLGAAAARNGLPESASPYPPETPNDLAWKQGHGSVTGAVPVPAAPESFPEGFSMGGPESRIPGDYTPPRLPRIDQLESDIARAEIPGASPVDLLPERGPANLYRRLSPEGIKAEYRAQIELLAKDQAEAVPPIWTEARQAEFVANAANQGLRGERLRVREDREELLGTGVHTRESAFAEQRVKARTKRVATLEHELQARGLDPVTVLLEAPPPKITPAPAPVTARSVAGTGELRTRGLSLGVEESAVARGLTDTLGDLPEYRRLSMADQASRAMRLLQEDPALARQVALGEAPPPADLLPESVFVAVEQDALAAGDVGTLRELASSRLTEQATEMGQRLRTLAERDPASPVRAMQQIEAARTNGARNPTKAIGEAMEAVNAALAESTKMTFEDFNKFIDDLRC